MTFLYYNTLKTAPLHILLDFYFKIFYNKNMNFEGPNEQHGYYFVPKMRENVYEFSKQLATYLHDEGINNIVFLDRAARLAWIGMDEYWKINYPDKPRPNIYFINPSGIDIIEGISRDFKEEKVIPEQDPKTGEIIIPLGDKESVINAAEDAVRNITNQFQQAYPKLEQEKHDPLALFDNCIHTGETIDKVLDYLQATGYKDVRVVIADDKDATKNTPEYKSLTPKHQIKGCYPFGHSELVTGVEKGGNVFSDYDKEADRVWVNETRKEIREIIRKKGK